MLKFLGKPAIVFAEFPNEISLIVNISGCVCHCESCSEPELGQDIGIELTYEEIDRIISENPGTTLFGFMGGDNDHKAIFNFAKYIQNKHNLKVGMYSGRDYLDYNLAGVLDYYKIGRWIPFEGPEDTWKNQTAGPLCLPTSNQIMFKRENDKLINITEKFRKFQINNWKTVLI